MSVVLTAEKKRNEGGFSAVILTAEMQARQGARAFSQGVYLDIHD